MRPRLLKTPSTWCRVVREADRAFVFYVGHAGEREAFRAFKYPERELPTIQDALEVGAALAAAPPMLSVVSVPVAFVARLDLTGPAARVPEYPVVREAYQLPTRDREAVRALLRETERRIGAHVDPFHEAEAVNLAARLHRALGAV